MDGLIRLLMAMSNMFPEPTPEELERKQKVLDKEFETYNFCKTYRVSEEVYLSYMADFETGEILKPQESLELLTHEFMITGKSLKVYYCNYCSLPHYHTIVLLNLDNKKLYRASFDLLDVI